MAIPPMTLPIFVFEPLITADGATLPLEPAANRRTFVWLFATKMRPLASFVIAIGRIQLGITAGDIYLRAYVTATSRFA